MNPFKLRQIVRAPLGDTDSGGSASGETAGTLSQAKQAVTATARDTAARIKSAAGDTAERAKSEAQRIASDTKDDTARKIGGYGSAIHESAKSLEREDPNIAWATHRVADRIQGVADYIRSRDLNDLRHDAEDYARRHPLAFFGGLFVGGLVMGNLLKARRPEEQTEMDMNESTDWDTGNQSGSGSMSDVPTASGI